MSIIHSGRQKICQVQFLNQNKLRCSNPGVSAKKQGQVFKSAPNETTCRSPATRTGQCFHGTEFLCGMWRPGTSRYHAGGVDFLETACRRTRPTHTDRVMPLISQREEKMNSLLCQLNNAGNQPRNFNAAFTSYWFSRGKSSCSNS